MRSWARTWWVLVALVAVGEAVLMRLDQAQADARVSASLEVASGGEAWFGRDEQGYEAWSRVVYDLPEAWSVVGLVLIAAGVALWRESRVSALVVTCAVLTGLDPTHSLAVTASLLATAALAAVAARSAGPRLLRLSASVVAGLLVLLLAVGGGWPPASVVVASTAQRAGRAVPVLLLVAALVFLAMAAIPARVADRSAAQAPPGRLRSWAWSVVAVAGAVQVAVVGAALVDRYHLVQRTREGTTQVVTVAIAQFTDAPQPVLLAPYLNGLAVLSAAVAALAAVLLRRVHPLVLGAIACFVLAALPLGTPVRAVLALAGFAIMVVVALREGRSSQPDPSL